jgi:CheY-like chemotaxis protein
MSSKGRIVVVDDAPESLSSAVALLTGEGYEVDGAADGDAAVQVIASRQPALIVYQILQPANGAIAFIRRLALTRELRPIPVLLVTALSEYQVASFLSGMSGVRRLLRAPCPPEALLEAVALALPHAVR